MLHKLSNHIVTITGGILLILINIANIVYYNKNYWPFTLSPFWIAILSLIFIAASLIGIYILKFLFNHATQQWLIWILLIAFLIRVIWIISISTPLSQDYLQLYKASTQLASGDTNIANTNYYIYFAPYMLGFVLYETSIIKLFGSSIFLLKLLNCIFSVLTIYFISKTTQKLFGIKASIISAIIMTVYVPNIAAVSVLTNDILAVCFFMFAFMLLTIKPLNFKNGIFAGAAIFAGNFIRPLSSIILIAIILYVLFIKFPIAKNKKSILTGLATLLLTFSIFSIGTDKLLVKSGLSQQSTISTNMNWKLALGLNSKTNGAWNLKDYQYVTSVKSPKERNKKAGKLVKQRTKSPKTIFTLFIRKFAIMWGDIDTMISWGTQKTGIPKILIGLLCVIQKVMYMCITLLALKSICSKKTAAAQFLVILLIGYILIHLGIEIQTRYHYFAMPLFIILAAGAYTTPNLKTTLTGRKYRKKFTA